METSIYLEKSLVRKVRAASASSGITIHNIFLHAARHIVSSARVTSSRSGSRYQSFPDTATHREIVHISLPHNLHEQCTDMRKVCKKSVSRLFAEVLKDSLDLIFLQLLGETRTTNYTESYQLIFTQTRSGYTISVEMRRSNTRDPATG
jgi:hypothetical protein